MSFISDLPKELQILISGYEPKFILLCDYSDWCGVLRLNLGEEFTAYVPSSELRRLYFEKCTTEKCIFPAGACTLIKSSPNKIYGCGTNPYAELGLGKTKFEEIAWAKNITNIPCGVYYTIILSNGIIMSCGRNIHGKLGHGKREYITSYEEIYGLQQNISKIVCGAAHTIILLSDGRIFSCGYNGYGQCGHNNSTHIQFFLEINGVPQNI